jgi:hypothetical protein
MLLSCGAHPALRNRKGFTPLDLSTDPDLRKVLKAACDHSLNESGEECGPVFVAPW